MNFFKGCAGCPLKTCKGIQIEPPSSPKKIVLVTDGPSSADLFEGSPFTGPEGKLLASVLKHHNIRGSDIHVTYTCSCKLPIDKAKKGYQKTEIGLCQARLFNELKKIKPQIVVPMGNTALQAFLGPKAKVGEAHGRTIWNDILQTWIMPTFNPRALLKSAKSFSDFTNDLGKLCEYSSHVPDAEQVKQDLSTKHYVMAEPGLALQALAFLAKQKKVACDIETSGFNFRKDVIYCLACSWEKGSAIVFTQEMLEDPIVSQEIKRFMENPAVAFGWQNGKFDTKFFRFRGIRARVDWDIMLKHYATDERRGTHGLNVLASVLLGAPDYKGDFWKKWKPHIKNLPEEALPQLYEYCASDADYTFRIDDILEPQFRAEGAVEAYLELLIPGSDAYATIEMNGFYVDAELLKQTADKYAKIVSDLNDQMTLIAYSAGWDSERYAAEVGSKSIPQDFNVNSPKQLGYVLFDLLKLPLYKGKRTTEEKALIYLANKVLKAPKEKYYKELYKPKDDADEATVKDMIAQGNQAYREAKEKWLSLGVAHRFIDALMTYRGKNILYTTFIGGISRALQDDGRVHASFQFHATETGRRACKEPNLQNMPRLSEIKNLLAAPPGRVLVQGDYSQAELRVLAVLSQDPFLMQIYYDGGDMHDEVARKLFGDGFTKEQRVRAKAVNFGLAYGRTEYTIAEEYDIPVPEAKQVMNDWFTNIPVAGSYIKARRQDPRRTGSTVTTVFGRKRRYPLITEDNAWNIENEAINFPISSTAADLTFKSVILIDKEFKRQKIDAKIVNEVHDSIVVETREDLVDQVVAIMRPIMQNIPNKILNTDMPFKADFEIGTHWGTMQKLKK